MKESYTAASTVPYKLFRNRHTAVSLQNGKVPLAHVQFIPTNKCNLHCSFCSCEKRDRTQVMGLEEVAQMVDHLAELGCEAVTITGGGDPLLHPDIDAILELFADAGIQIGLVTNGTLFDRCTKLDLCTWVRVSCCDERPFDDWRVGLTHAMHQSPNVDWALSYVLSSEPNIANLAEHIDFANVHDMTHVRVVADLFHTGDVPMESVKSRIHLNQERVIWQGRTDSEHGVRDCLISLLKPVIGPDGTVYPCCGVQYATEEPSFDLTAQMAMGNWRDLPTLPYDGSRCVTCYYGDYNRALSTVTGEMHHIAFV